MCMEVVWTVAWTSVCVLMAVDGLGLHTAWLTHPGQQSRHSGRPNSFAYVQFDTEDAAERAANRAGEELMGRPVEISLSADAVEAGGKLGKPVEGCWFCLSNAGADIDLVVSVGAWRLSVFVVSTILSLQSLRMCVLCDHQSMSIITKTPCVARRGVLLGP